jgi:NitT/TauT family transport system substrate-binding protein
MPENGLRLVMHKTIGVWLTLATIVVLACGDQAGAQTKLVIGYTSLGDVGTNFVAKEEGFFAKRNLDVELKALRGGSVIVPGLVVGEAQIGTLAPPVFLQAVDGGIDLTALTGLSVLTKGMKSAAVVARTGLDIKSPADLVGRRTGVSGIGSISEVLYREWLRQKGIDSKKMTFVEVPFPSMRDLLHSGRVDVIIIPDPLLSQIVSSGVGYVVAYFFGELPDGASQMINASTRAWAQNNPGAVANYKAAIEEASAFIATNGDRTKAIIAKYLNLPEAVVRDSELPRFVASIDPAQMQWWIDVLSRQDMLRSKLDPAQLVAK